MLTRIERLETGRVVGLHIHEAVGGVSVEVKDRLKGAEREEIGQKVWWMLGLGQDFTAFYKLARKEPSLTHVEEKALGRLLRSPTLFEDAVKTILTTNTTWQGTIRMVSALVAAYGDPLHTDPSRHAFPAPSHLARASESDLRQLGLGYRAAYVRALAQLVCDGGMDLEVLKTSPTPEIRRQLLAIKGIGDYASASLLMLLGRYDYLPIDSWARKLVSEEWYDGKPVGPDEVEKAFEQWDSWKGLAYWFWRWSSQE
jgi:3-methyladenine DNA glycosylase/8-oxoguanine DNA glycosylase